MKNVIITGSTGMVGKGVLLECLDSSNIERVLVINRSSINMHHSKLKEILLPDFQSINTLKDQLKGYEACFFCMGVSSVGMKEEKFHSLTYDITKAFADILSKVNPAMVFNYVSGAGTDSTEKGRIMWARVKGKTENMVFHHGFKDAYAFRPGMIIPEKGITPKPNWYSALYVIMRPLFPLLKKSKNITSTTKLGQAMINSLFYPQSLKILHNKEINDLAMKSIE